MWGAALFAFALALALWSVGREAPGASRAETPSSPYRVRRGLASVMKNPQSWMVALFGMTICAPLLAFAALWGVPFMMQAHGLERPAAAVSISLMLVGCGVGGLLVGWISDTLRRRKTPMMVSAVLSLVGFAVLVYVPDLPLLAAQALLFLSGLASGSMALLSATAREHNRPEAGATAMGFANMCASLLGAVLQPVIGWILDLNWDGRLVDGARIYSHEAYKIAFLTLIASGVVAVGAALLVRETHCRLVFTSRETS